MAERYRLRLNRNYWEGATLNLKLEALRAVVLTESRGLARVNDRLRALLIKVVVEWENGRVALHWRYGGHSYVAFWHKLQNGLIRNTLRLWRRRGIAHAGSPGRSRRGEIFEGEVACRMLDVLEVAERPLGAWKIALRMVDAAGQSAPGEKEFADLMRKVSVNLLSGPNRPDSGSKAWSLRVTPFRRVNRRLAAKETSPLASS